MVALRKDVKVGLVLGGILLAVVGVYLVLSALTGGSGAKNGADPVALHTTSDGGDPTASKTPDATRTPDATPTKSTAATSAKPPANVPAPATPTVANNAAPAKPVAPTPAADPNDIWATALNTGTVPAARTVTPDRPTNASREPAAKPDEIIRSLNSPSAPADGGATASARDTTSGSLAGGDAAAKLTRTPAAPAAANGAAKTHVVASGETLSAISESEYGSPNLYRVIAEANPNVDPGRLKVGTTLNIPPHDATKEAAKHAATTKPAAGQAATPAANVDPAKQYVVKPGDSLHKIASTLYGDSAEWEAIYNANKPLIGESPANLKVGQTLALPKPPTKK